MLNQFDCFVIFQSWIIVLKSVSAKYRHHWGGEPKFYQSGSFLLGLCRGNYISSPFSALFNYRVSVSQAQISYRVISLRDVIQCRNVWSRMLGSDTTIRFFCLIYICFLNGAAGEVPCLKPFQFIPQHLTNLVWFQILRRIFPAILMFSKLDNFVPSAVLFKRFGLFLKSQFFSAGWLSSWHLAWCCGGCCWCCEMGLAWPPS